MVASSTTVEMRAAWAHEFSPLGSIRMQFVDGPFDWLHGVWQFTPLGSNVSSSGPAGCKIALDLDFEVSNRLTGFAFRLGFQKLADRMVDDFCAEAKRTYA